MATFHLTVKIISRGKGQSAIAAAAYRSGETLLDEQANEVKSYAARSERIKFVGIYAPKDAPEWAQDRNRLWNEAERAEKRKDSQLAREIEVSLPHELTDEQRRWLVQDFVREEFVRKGYVADVAIHAPDKDSDARNHHAHILLTVRTLGPEGFAAKKDLSINGREPIAKWREQWAHHVNRHLERHGHEARVDHRSLAAQGIDREPGVHLGYAAKEIAARGAQSDRMDELQGVQARNGARAELKAAERELAELEAELAREQAAAANKTARGGAETFGASSIKTVKTPAPIITKQPAVLASLENDAGRLTSIEAAAKKTARREAENPGKSRTENVSTRAQVAEQQAAALAQAKSLASDPARLARIEAENKLAAADKADSKTLKAQPIGHDYFLNAKATSAEICQERKDAAADQKQAAWKEDRDAHRPGDRAPKDCGGAFTVAGAAGAVSKLGDFVCDLLAGIGGGGAPSKEFKAGEYLTDPSARREQRQARLAEREAADRDRKALANMSADMAAGRSFSAADVRNLTREHQEQIRDGGDDAVRLMIDELRKREDDRGRERE